MIKLKSVLSSGEIITIPQFLSWQIDDKELFGTWKFIEMISLYGTCYGKLQRIEYKPLLDNQILVENKTLSYLAGEHVDNIEGVFLDPEIYQPDPNENPRNYLTDREEFGFFYVGLSIAADRHCIESALLKEKWIYKIKGEQNDAKI